MSAPASVRVLRVGHPVKDSKVRCYADVVIDGITIRSVRVIDGSRGTFISGPSEKGSDEQWHQLVEFDEDTAAAVLAAIVERPA